MDSGPSSLPSSSNPTTETPPNPTGTKSKKKNQTQKTQKSSEQHQAILCTFHYPKARNWPKN